jgi:streptomycin 6-kinase
VSLDLEASQPAFVQATLTLFGADGRRWLDRLPALLTDYAKKWSLRLSPPFPNLSYNYVAPAARVDGAAVVLKIGFPRPELRREIAALRLYAGQGMVNLLAADGDGGAMLLERLTPGTMLVELEDDRATRIAADIMGQLWRPLPGDSEFQSVNDWLDGLAKLRREFDGGTGPFPRRLVEMAESLTRDLLATAAKPVLLHGDLHHYNILAAQRSPWLAIDPKGVAGEPAYDTGAWLRNPLDWRQRPSPGRTLARRVAIFSEMLHLDAERIVAWGVVQAVLSAWWSYEDHGQGWEAAVACAELLARQLNGNKLWLFGNSGG